MERRVFLWSEKAELTSLWIVCDWNSARNPRRSHDTKQKSKIHKQWRSVRGGIFSCWAIDNGFHTTRVIITTVTWGRKQHSCRPRRVKEGWLKWFQFIMVKSKLQVPCFVFLSPFRNISITCFGMSFNIFFIKFIFFL